MRWSIVLCVAACALLWARGTCAERRYYHNDMMGSVLAITNASGTVVCREEYRPFGAEHSTWTGCDERKYTGKLLDAATGLYSYGSRYYDPDTARFISADLERGDQASLQSQNRYSYVMNNPFKFVDPTGRRAVFAARSSACR